MNKSCRAQTSSASAFLRDGRSFLDLYQTCDWSPNAKTFWTFLVAHSFLPRLRVDLGIYRNFQFLDLFEKKWFIHWAFLGVHSTLKLYESNLETLIENFHKNPVIHSAWIFSTLDEEHYFLDDRIELDVLLWQNSDAVKWKLFNIKVNVKMQYVVN